MWDWSAFLPSVFAIFVGVILSVLMWLMVTSLLSWHRRREWAKETREAIVQELRDNEEKIKSLKDMDPNEASFEIPGKLATEAYGFAFHGGRVRLLGRSYLQRELYHLEESYKYLNSYLRRVEDFVAQNWLLQAGGETDGEADKIRSVIEDMLKFAAEFAERLLEKTIAVREKLEKTK